jgi:hypothetical protein
VNQVASISKTAGGITQPLSLLLVGYGVVVYGAGAAFLAAGILFLVAILSGLSSRALREV